MKRMTDKQGARSEYEQPMLTIIPLCTRDIITTSGEDKDDNAGEWDPQILG